MLKLPGPSAESTQFTERPLPGEHARSRKPARQLQVPALLPHLSGNSCARTRGRCWIMNGGYSSSRGHIAPPTNRLQLAPLLLSSGSIWA